MDKSTIEYKCGFKYQLTKDYRVQTGIVRDKKSIILTEFVDLFTDEQLLIRKHFAWDGPSGCTIDTKNFMRGSLVHDALYQLIREGKLNIKWREQADKELKRICLEDGMSKIRAWYVYRAVRRFAKFAALPKNKKEVLEAP